ncbi:acyltransferase family protein [Stutzerimonas nitrititolerans]|uniref:acyltransferase family protein n=1 Tax=Stutzerimonas nitrititolerans TaxID=2482751 RepID=UPI0028A9ABCB|nr:acyltransferase family protein [Stutzerimonas nitrititolerans]
MASNPTIGDKPKRYHPNYRPDIDGLRALAVVAVVIYHAFPEYLRGGFIGVDIFFVISGYLISGIIFGSVTKESFNLVDFYERRINRIFPALLIVLSSCLVFGWYTLFAVEYEQLGKHIGGGSAFISNILLWDESGYFDTAAEVKPLLHLWSLGIEEQFYIFWPIIIWVAHKLRVNFLIAALALAAVSFGLNIKNIASDASFVFYMPHTRAWELLCGSVLAYYAYFYSSNSASRPIIRNLMSAMGVISIVIGLYLITSEDAFPGYWALIPVVGATLLIAGGPDAWLNKYLFSFKPFVWIGLISFPLYLWHWPLLTFARIIEGDIPSVHVRLAAVFCSALLAWATYALIERPLRRVVTKLKPAILIAMMVSLGSTGYATYLMGGLPDRASVKSSETFNSQFVGPLWKYAQNDLCRTKYPFADANEYGWFFCITNKDAPPTILLLGTSFANHLYPGLASSERTSGHSILSIGACSPEMIDVTDPNAPTDTSPCSGNRPYKQKMLINGIIEKSRSIEYTIIDGLISNPDSAYIDRLTERISYLEDNGIKVIVFTPHITADRDLKGCFSRPLKAKPDDCKLGVEERKKIDDGFSTLIQKIRSSNPGVKFYDQNEVFCSKVSCSLTIDGMPIFRDNYSHYSEYASKQVSKHFIKWAEENEPEMLKD